MPRLALDYCAQTRSSVSPRNNVPCLCSVKLDVICYLLTTTVVCLTGKLAAEAEMDNPLRLSLWFPSGIFVEVTVPCFLDKSLETSSHKNTALLILPSKFKKTETIQLGFLMCSKLLYLYHFLFSWHETRVSITFFICDCLWCNILLCHKAKPNYKSQLASKETAERSCGRRHTTDNQLLLKSLLIP